MSEKKSESGDTHVIWSLSSYFDNSNHDCGNDRNSFLVNEGPAIRPGANVILYSANGSLNRIKTTIYNDRLYIIHFEDAFSGRLLYEGQATSKSEFQLYYGIALASDTNPIKGCFANISNNTVNISFDFTYNFPAGSDVQFFFREAATSLAWFPSGHSASMNGTLTLTDN
jgi:hypothetical protein